MFKLIDGEPVVSNFKSDEQAYFALFVKEFGDISISQWRASFEYQCSYSDIQMSVETGAITLNSINSVLTSLVEINSIVNMPAVLHSQLPSRFLDAGYIATSFQATKSDNGTLKICVDYDGDKSKSKEISELIVYEMLPAGQFIDGSISEPVVLSNGDVVIAKWSTPDRKKIDFKITLKINRNSQSVVDPVETILKRFIDNFNKMNQMGKDITPSLYYQISTDAPWASEISTTYSIDNSGSYVDSIYSSTFKDKFTPNLDPVNVIIIG